MAVALHATRSLLMQLFLGLAFNHYCINRLFSSPVCKQAQTILRIIPRSTVWQRKPKTSLSFTRGFHLREPVEQKSFSPSWESRGSLRQSRLTTC